MQDLMLELSRAANWVCDEVRKHLMPSYRLKQGQIVVKFGTTFHFVMGFKVYWHIPRYREIELQRQIPYPGLEAFKAERASKDIQAQ